MAAARLAIGEALTRLNQPLESTPTTERAALPEPMTLEARARGRLDRTGCGPRRWPPSCCA